MRVVIGGISVAGPPRLPFVGCTGESYVAGAQKAWLWDGRNVYISLLLSPGKCSVAGKTARVMVILRTAGT